jgi:hypothetical protein
MNVSNILQQHEEKTAKSANGRPAIEWEKTPAHVLEGEHAKVEISRSIERFPRYSYRVGGRKSPFLRPHVERSSSFNTPDMVVNGASLAAEVGNLLQQASAWVDEQLKEHAASRIASAVSREGNRRQNGPAPRVTGKTERERERNKKKNKG